MFKLKATLAIVGAFVTIGTINTTTFANTQNLYNTTTNFTNYVSSVNSDLGVMENDIESNVGIINNRQNTISNNSNTINSLNNEISTYNNEISTWQSKLSNLQNNGASGLTPNEIEHSTPYANKLVPQAIANNGQSFIQAQYNLEQQIEGYYLNNGSTTLGQINSAKQGVLGMELS